MTLDRAGKLLYGAIFSNILAFALPLMVLPTIGFATLALVLVWKEGDGKQ